MVWEKIHALGKTYINEDAIFIPI